MKLNEILRSGQCSDGTVRISEVLLYLFLICISTFFRYLNEDQAEAMFKSRNKTLNHSLIMRDLIPETLDHTIQCSNNSRVNSSHMKGRDSNSDTSIGNLTFCFLYHLSIFISIILHFQR